MNLHFNITQDWKSWIRPKIVGHYAIPFCKHKYEDPNIVCPVDLANDERLKKRCEHIGYCPSEHKDKDDEQN